MNYKSGWLTLNRACNLRCKWCYAKGTGFKVKDDMDLELAYKLIDLFKELNIKSICLIGGEPTVYKHLTEVIKYANEKKIRLVMVTNGVCFADEEYLDSIIQSGIRNFNISLKGYDKKSYKEVTGFDCYDKVMKAINNLSKRKVSFSISMVLTEDNIRDYTKGLKEAFAAGARKASLSFCYDFSIDQKYKKDLSKLNPMKVINGFINSYDELDKVTSHNFSLHQTYPLCLWDKNFIKKLEEKDQITSVCQLLTKSGLLFDTHGNIIPCNAMYEIKIGKYDKDFNDKDSLLKYMGNNNIKKLYNRLCGLPSKECIKCNSVSNCGGGCVCQWTNYSFDELMKKVK